jgi:hypothetical protein
MPRIKRAGYGESRAEQRLNSRGLSKQVSSRCVGMTLSPALRFVDRERSSLSKSGKLSTRDLPQKQSMHYWTTPNLPVLQSVSPK